MHRASWLRDNGRNDVIQPLQQQLTSSSRKRTITITSQEHQSTKIISSMKYFTPVVLSILCFGNLILRFSNAADTMPSFPSSYSASLTAYPKIIFKSSKRRHQRRFNFLFSLKKQTWILPLINYLLSIFVRYDGAAPRVPNMHSNLWIRNDPSTNTTYQRVDFYPTDTKNEPNNTQIVIIHGKIIFDRIRG